MPTQCCVPLCTNKGGHRFPKDSILRKKWIQAVKRGEHKWKPSSRSVVCPNHFDASDYKTTTNEGDPAQIRRLKTDSVPHIFPWKSALTPSQRQRRERGRKLQATEDSRSAWKDVGANVEISLEDFEQEGHENDSGMQPCVPQPIKESVDSHSQTDFNGLHARDFALNDDTFHKLTGLISYNNFAMVFATFGDEVENMNYYYGWKPKMDLEDQFFLTIIRLRMNKPTWETAIMFRIHDKEVSNMFITWINFLYFHFKDIDWWPSRDLVQYFSPTDFRKKFSTTRVIIDGTEIPLQKPKKPIAQQATYSTYKNRNTVKALIGVTPGGLISFVSDVFGGATSDRQICERSNLLNKVESGDSIMADKGFNVQDMFIDPNVEINIPEFFRKKTRLSEKSVLKDRKIASKRVHVERLIGLAKTFKMLTSPLSVTDAPLADAIVTSAFFLCNYRPCIVPTDA
ncbi:hypothetical protein Pmani_008248 [Petrolisthes manimaculis]|uniref:THAP-type domain-containing protein n=1 Tax=Petrolisthes manimaculis TaxID=1843537 RepID=A0AAE1Q923_9EUCA|nr:hypothetical protein Pmani_008248 [Petrolisthes manimaculis]